MGLASEPCHIIAVPFPGRGHVNPMLILCRHLAAAAAARDIAITITFVVTEEWLGLLGSSNSPPPPPECVQFATMPNVIPSEHRRAADHAGFLDAVYNKMEEPFEWLLGQLPPPAPAAIVADTYLPWAVAVGRRRGIPVCSLWTMSATFFSALYHFDRWPTVDGEATDQNHRDESSEQYVPGLSSVIRLSDLKQFRSVDRTFKLALRAFSWVRKAQCVLFTSFHEVEDRVINALRQELPCPVYPLGPSIPYVLLGDSSDGMLRGENHEDYFSWLDAQPRNSVLYVSLGSFLSVSRAQLDEIAMGLRDSGTRFFWVARGESPRLQEMCGSTGLVVPWCDQLKVLCHPSVAGFLSHCGWNSTLEAVYAGVPMLAFPIFWDQLTNGRLVVDEWKIGLNLKEKYVKACGGIVGRTEIAVAVKKFVDLDDAESIRMRARASELRDASRRAIREGGSSHCFMNCFVVDLTEGKLNVAST